MFPVTDPHLRREWLPGDDPPQAVWRPQWLPLSAAKDGGEGVVVSVQQPVVGTRGGCRGGGKGVQKICSLVLKNVLSGFNGCILLFFFFLLSKTVLMLSWIF